MPNIIEQQDLLKGLPDNRLALLLQKPDASIPPFLVAAEAQRRQAIRQQFAGDAGKESVVDSLTKQLANVPQNIQAPMQRPPQLPQPMPQAGIAALQPQQAPQQMAGGGEVQRYQTGGQIQPLWTIPDYSGVIPRVGDWVGETARGVYDWATTPYSEKREDREENKDAGLEFTPDIPIPPRKPEFSTSGEPSPYTDLTPKTPAPRKETSGQGGTSVENRDKAESEGYRKRIEELYGVSEPSNWEEAQKWFAMSSAIMNPGSDLMQGLVNAGSIYAMAESEQAQAQREGDIELQRALLQYDLGERDYAREVAAAAAEKADDRAWKLKERMVPEASSAINAYGELIKGIDKRLEDPMLDDTTKQNLMRQRQSYEMQLANIMRMGGFSPSGVITRDQLGI